MNYEKTLVLRSHQPSELLKCRFDKDYTLFDKNVKRANFFLSRSRLQGHTKAHVDNHVAQFSIYLGKLQSYVLNKL